MGGCIWNILFSFMAGWHMGGAIEMTVDINCEYDSKDKIAKYAKCDQHASEGRLPTSLVQWYYRERQLSALDYNNKDKCLERKCNAIIFTELERKMKEVEEEWDVLGVNAMVKLNMLVQEKAELVKKQKTIKKSKASNSVKKKSARFSKNIQQKNKEKADTTGNEAMQVFYSSEIERFDQQIDELLDEGQEFGEMLKKIREQMQPIT